MSMVAQETEILQGGDSYTCQVCHREYPLKYKYWGRVCTGTCKKCKKRRADDIRAVAKSWRPLIIHRSQGKCEVCGFYCPAILRIHHKRPVAKGGNSREENLIALCPNCHAIVHAVTPGDEKALYGLSLWLGTFMPDDQQEKIYDLIITHARNFND